MRHRLHEPLTVPTPNIVSLPPGVRHIHSTTIALTSEAYRLIAAPEQCWTAYDEHPVARHCQKSLRIDGNLITVSPPK